MLDKGVRVGRAFPPFYDWCRISTGTSQEVDKFISAMLEIYSWFIKPNNLKQP